MDLLRFDQMMQLGAVIEATDSFKDFDEKK
jgi:hypothetical protein